MKLTRLRIVGFKSFVEPTDVLIEAGLTGVVGPNGCGKSNLVEALRWVMGESSHKSMRAAGMEEVIFAGSGSRPARNAAEVLLAEVERNRPVPRAKEDPGPTEVDERRLSLAERLGVELANRRCRLRFANAGSRHVCLLPTPPG